MSEQSAQAAFLCFCGMPMFFYFLVFLALWSEKHMHDDK